MSRVIARFSCGAASAVATKMAIEKYGDAVEIFYTDPGSEHPDNTRFMRDCEVWLGKPITVLRSTRYRDTWDCFERRRYIGGVQGAPCTSELKRIPGEAVWRRGDVEIFGYTIEERHRVARFIAHNSERIIECPLIDAGMTKVDCFAALVAAGIALPAMYRLGFSNNNCIGCVKARDNLNYWKRIRKHFPESFERMAKLERQLCYPINRVTKKGVRVPIYLDEIAPGEPKQCGDPLISCGLFCMAEAQEGGAK